MGMKLHRNRRVFRARRLVPRIIASVLGAAAIVALGFFGAKYFSEHPMQSAPSESTDSVQSDTSTPVGDPTTSTTNDPVQVTPSLDTVRAFYLPFSVLKNASTLNTTLAAAADAGFNSVVFELKDSGGNLLFRSETARAVQVGSFTGDALTMNEVKTLFSAIREAGLLPIPRLYAFMDNAAAKALPDARISHQSDGTWVWYDANPAKGGKAWLNPYADEAHTYIIELAKELRDAGAAAIMLDGVQFPSQTSSASFGNSANTSMQRDEILTAFVNKATALLGADCPVLLSCTADSALGSNTLVYGNNPLTFAPSIAAPLLLTGDMKATVTVGNETLQNTPDTLGATVQAMVNQMSLRIKVMSADKQPKLAPWLQAYDYTAAQIKAAIDGCIAGGADSFILYNPNGQYDFAALS
ncbi:MAG: hypothetical protein IJB26_02565 [Clostridia bacterium]|nr:hypothetical protein [Clostridia bacterium]